MSIAAALVSRPGALVVDDPMANLSHAAGNRIMHALKVRLRCCSVVDACCNMMAAAHGDASTMAHGDSTVCSAEWPGCGMPRPHGGGGA